MVAKATHNVLRIVAEKPQNLSFTPGQATDVAINKTGWQEEKRPFTFTCLPGDDHLEFTIKTYTDHNGVTNELLKLKANDELIISEPWGSINYKGEGVFLAAGAGVTPFISILRDLRAKQEIGNNKLIFANKTQADIIHEGEFRDVLGENFINILSDEESNKYAHGFISEDLLKEADIDTGKYFYLCGPPPMMESVEEILHKMNVDEDRIVKEEF